MFIENIHKKINHTLDNKENLVNSIGLMQTTFSGHDVMKFEIKDKNQNKKKLLTLGNEKK